VTLANRYVLRPARPVDYDAIAAVVDDWWGRPVLPALPRLFLDHFHDTSLVAESTEGLGGFLVGLMSPAEPDRAYIHFVGVHPQARSTGLARTMYGEFFGIAREHHRSVVQAVTSPVNRASIAFHRRLGFTVTEPVPDYNGPGHDLVVFERSVSSLPRFETGPGEGSPERDRGDRSGK
jgi:ribosomal protein S18 acetylase RimI-like enzyme